MASRSTEAMVEGRILKWARDTAGLSPEEAARLLHVNHEKVLAWEEERHTRACRSSARWR
jgi:DNA-binding transcriptional regulator YiaG